VTKRKRIIVLLVAVLAVSVVAFLYLQKQKEADADNLRVSGNIEVTDAELSFKLPGRVSERLISEGEFAQEGQLVARQDSEEMEQEVALREADLRAAMAVLAELEAGSRPEEIAQSEARVRGAKARLDELLAGSRVQDVAVAEASVRRAEAESERNRLEYERQQQLLEREVISAREFEMAKAAYDVSIARVNEAREQLNLVIEGPRTEEIDRAREALKEAEENLALIRKGPRVETIDQARARADQAGAALGLAKIRLNYSKLYSPLSGVVLSENVEPGEYVSAGTPIVTVGNLENVWLRAFIDEEDLGRVRVGQEVDLTTDTYPGKVYKGRLSFISSEAEFTPKTVQTAKERVKLVYRIKVDVPNVGMELKPGMPADARIILSKEDL